MPTYTDISDQTIDGEGAILAEAIILDGCSNLTITGYTFTDTYGVRAIGDPSTGITVVDCIHRPTGSDATLFWGNSLVDIAAVTRCHAYGARLVLTGDSIGGWTVTDSSSYDADDSAIYLRNGGHTVTGNTVIRAGKDGIKIRDGSQVTYTASTVSNNTVQEYGRVEASAGGAFNFDVDNVTLTGNTATMLADYSSLNSAVKGFNVGGTGCTLQNNVVITSDAGAIAFKIDEAITDLGGNVTYDQSSEPVIQVGTDPTKALHKALLAALNSVCSCSVYDGVPQDAAFPYVVIDYSISDNSDFLSSRMDVRFVYLMIWSRVLGQAEVMDIISEIETLNEQKLALDTGAVASLRVDSKRTAREDDNLTFRGQVTLRIITTH